MKNRETALLTLDIRAYWHAGQGKGSASYLDSETRVDGDGLPFLPGRTVRGLLRHAVSLAEDWGQVEPGTTLALFGGWDANVPTRHNGQPGCLIVDNALPPEVLRVWLRTRDDRESYRQMLLQPLFSTAIDHASGCAKEHSLRGIQVAVPLTLTAPLTCTDPPASWRESIRLALPLITGVGAHRNRGLGRAVLSLVAG